MNIKKLAAVWLLVSFFVVVSTFAQQERIPVPAPQEQKPEDFQIRGTLVKVPGIAISKSGNRFSATKGEGLPIVGSQDDFDAVLDRINRIGEELPSLATKKEVKDVSDNVSKLGTTIEGKLTNLNTNLTTLHGFIHDEKTGLEATRNNLARVTNVVEDLDKTVYNQQTGLAATRRSLGDVVNYGGIMLLVVMIFVVIMVFVLRSTRGTLTRHRNGINEVRRLQGLEPVPEHDPPQTNRVVPREAAGRVPDIQEGRDQTRRY